MAETVTRNRRPGGRRGGGSRPVEQVEITAIAAGGEGVGRLGDGRAVFIHRTAPGDLVEAEIVHERPRWARGRLHRLIRSSPERRDPPCPHYTLCGGCTVEHLKYPAQLAAKSRIVQDALGRIGGIPVEAPEVVASPSEFRYRNRVTFTLRRLGRGQVIAGFHEIGNPGRIVQIDGRCLLPEPAISASWEKLRSAWGDEANLLPSGESLRLTLRATASGEVSLLVAGGYSDGKPRELLAAVPEIQTLEYLRENGTIEHIAGVRHLPERWGNVSFEVAGSVFLQVNRQAAERLEDYVALLAGEVNNRAVVDAYCGIGLHARRLSSAGAKVVGIEVDGHAISIARTIAPEARFILSRVEDALAEVLPSELLVLNPPRSGVAAEAIAMIQAAPPDRIIYVSCDPATLARDLARLASEYEITNVRCFDLFPQTAHVETVVALNRH